MTPVGISSEIRPRFFFSEITLGILFRDSQGRIPWMPQFLDDLDSCHNSFWVPLLASLVVRLVLEKSTFCNSFFINKY